MKIIEGLELGQACCFSCGAWHNMEELSRCLRCGVPICGRRETNCRAKCLCDARELARSVNGNVTDAPQRPFLLSKEGNCSETETSVLKESKASSENIGKFATELNRLIKSHEPRLSTRLLAGELGLTFETIRRLRRGHHSPSKPTMILISKLFDVKESDLQTWVKHSKLAKEYGPEIADILFDPERRPVEALNAQQGSTKRAE
jgi:transcriptional regulator with XRE-family HTH domain